MLVRDVLTASHVAYTALRIAGALYLTWMGASMLRHSFRRRGLPDSDLQSNGVLDGTLVRSWTRGLTTNLLNPKIGVFYMAMLPQFIPQNSPHLLMGLALAGVHDVEGLVWFSGLIFGRTWPGAGCVEARRTASWTGSPGACSSASGSSSRVRGRDPISNRGIVPKPLSGQALSSSCP